MKEIRYFFVPDASKRDELPEDEATHAIRVLRLKEGDEICLLDGVGHVLEAEVSMVTSKHCFYNVKNCSDVEKTWLGHIHLAIAPTKMMDRMEWMVEKATEIGFDEITFLDCRFSERKTLRKDRIEKIVCAAVKQSRKSWMPKVNGMVDFKTFVKQPFEGKKYIAHCYREFPKIDFFNTLQQTKNTGAHDNVLVLVGPEGDFSVDEVRYATEEGGFSSISLGKSRLRTETAGLSAVMMAQLVLRK